VEKQVENSLNKWKMTGGKHSSSGKTGEIEILYFLVIKALSLPLLLMGTGKRFMKNINIYPAYLFIVIINK
jgi:hypothetical protein